MLGANLKNVHDCAKDLRLELVHDVACFAPHGVLSQPCTFFVCDFSGPPPSTGKTGQAHCPVLVAGP